MPLPPSPPSGPSSAHHSCTQCCTQCCVFVWLITWLGDFPIAWVGGFQCPPHTHTHSLDWCSCSRMNGRTHHLFSCDQDREEWGNPNMLPWKEKLCLNDIVSEGSEKRQGERGVSLLSLHTDMQTLSLSDLSHLSHRQGSDFTCVFCPEMWLKSWCITSAVCREVQRTGR